MIKNKNLVKKCSKCNSEGTTSSISKIINKKSNNGVEQVVYMCCKCKAISRYENDILVSVE